MTEDGKLLSLFNDSLEDGSHERKPMEFVRLSMMNISDKSIDKRNCGNMKKSVIKKKFREEGTLKQNTTFRFFTKSLK